MDSRGRPGRAPWTGLVVAVALSFGAPAAAHAETFCVAKPGCSGTSQPTTTAAVAAAAANGSGRDRIEIGPGTFSSGGSGLKALDTNPIDISGSGRGITFLTTDSSAPAPTLVELRGDSTVRDLTARVANQSSDAVGFFLKGTSLAERVDVVTQSPVTNGDGVVLQDAATYRSGSVAMPGTATAGVAFNFPVTGAGPVVEDVTASADAIGARVGDTATLRRVRLHAPSSMTVTCGCTAKIEDSVLSGGASGISMGGGSNSVVASHLTLFGSNSPGSVAISVNADAGTRSVSLRNSIIRNFATDLQRTQSGSGTATLAVDYSNYDPVKVTESGGGGITGGNNVNVDPLFVNPAGGNFHLRAASPLIDAGDPALLSASESTTDADGRPRIVDGNGDGFDRRDMGAFEYQRLAPLVTASATPATRFIGQAFRFSATGLDLDPGDTLTFKWKFDDGASANGRVVNHAFKKLGSHRGTVTVTDNTGLKTVAGASATVVPKPGPCANLFNGTKRNDTISGTGFGDRILGLDGNDTLKGLTGDDCLDGGKGKNKLLGGDGADVIKSKNGQTDTVDCGKGDDSVKADHADKLKNCEHVKF